MMIFFKTKVKGTLRAVPSTQIHKIEQVSNTILIYTSSGESTPYITDSNQVVAMPISVLYRIEYPDDTSAIAEMECFYKACKEGATAYRFDNEFSVIPF